MKARLGVGQKLAPGLVERDATPDAMQHVEHGLVLGDRDANSVVTDNGHAHVTRHVDGLTRASRVPAIEVPIHTDAQSIAKGLRQRLERLASERRWCGAK
jgi:hypothetical protein